MRPAARLGLYAVGVLAIFGIGAGVGTALGSDPPSDHAPVTIVEHLPGDSCVSACSGHCMSACSTEASHP